MGGTNHADVWIDIGDTIDTKIAALQAHESQVGTDTRPDWDLAKVVRERAQTVAEGHDMQYAEAFKYFKLKLAAPRTSDVVRTTRWLELRLATQEEDRADPEGDQDGVRRYSSLPPWDVHCPGQPPLETPPATKIPPTSGATSGAWPSAERRARRLGSVPSRP